jgi:hypothetical protein
VELKNDLKDCEKIIVSNPNTNVAEAEKIHYEATPEALDRIGTLTGFEVDSQNNNLVNIPPIVTAAINSKTELRSAVSTLEESCSITFEDHEGSSNNFSSDLPPSGKKLVIVKQCSADLDPN